MSITFSGKKFTSLRSRIQKFNDYPINSQAVY